MTLDLSRRCPPSRGASVDGRAPRDGGSRLGAREEGARPRGAGTRIKNAIRADVEVPARAARPPDRCGVARSRRPPSSAGGDVVRQDMEPTTYLVAFEIRKGYWRGSEWSMIRKPSKNREKNALSITGSGTAHKPKAHLLRSEIRSICSDL